MSTFKNLSIILPVMDETYSLLETVRIAQRDSDEKIGEFIFVYCENTRPPTLEVCERLCRQEPDRFRMIKQELPFLGGAIRSAFPSLCSSHALIMSSDLETDPHSISDMIKESERFPEAIITATRWHPGAGFTGYHPIKWVLNFFFQKVFKVLYSSELSDPTFGYRIIPTELVQKTEWQEVRHAFVLETLLKPLKQGVIVYEVPSKWVARKEGVSHNSFWGNIGYFLTLIRVSFQS